jgi:hypothetical protein
MSSSNRSWFSGEAAGTRWFILAVILSAIGIAVLIYVVVQNRNSPPASPTDTVAGIQTNVAMTMTAKVAIPPSDTPLFQFTPPGTATPTITPSPQAGTTVIYFPSATSGGNPCNASQYVSDVTIPDGTLMAFGTNFIKTWKFQNTGTCSWGNNYELIYISGNLMGGQTTKINQTVAPGQQAQVSVALTSPSVNGTYTGYWRLADAVGNGFGVMVYVQIVASSTIPTSTKTFTPTSTGGSTATASSTSVGPTHTSTPTSPAADTATSSPTASDTPVPPTETLPSDTATFTDTPTSTGT